MPQRKVKDDTIQKCQKLWERIYPQVKMPHTYYREMFYESKKEKVLEIGAGNDSALDLSDTFSVGIDIDEEALRNNSSIKYRVVASAHALPFANSVFDTVVTQYVLEHIEKPDSAFSEISRVSQPGSQFIFLTTNSSSYLGFIFRHTPQWIHNLVKKRFIGMDEKEIYPVYMRCNTPRKIEDLLVKKGFDRPEYVFVGGPFYFQFSYVLFRLAVLAEKLTDGRLKRMKFYIAGRAVKKI